jgi:hypothetical protein
MEELDTLLTLSEHNSAEGPRTSESVLRVLDTEIANWSLDQWQQAHAKHNIHIIPASPPEGMTFSATTCEKLGIDIHQTRQVHGKPLEFG